MEESHGTAPKHGRHDAASAFTPVQRTDTETPRGPVPSTRGEGFTAHDMREYREWASDIPFD